MGNEVRTGGSGRRRGGGLRRWRAVRSGLGALVVCGSALMVASCGETIDTDRKVERLGSLGEDMYGVICDRLGASCFSEDLTGASYRRVCHYDRNGAFAGEVDLSVLPPATNEASQRARALSVAKMNRLIERRVELIEAFNNAFPDIVISNEATADPADTIRLHDAVLDFSQEVSRLYEENPASPGGPPAMPMQTQALGRLFGALEAHPEALAVFERMSARIGYRPSDLALGAVRVALSYPHLRALGRTALEVLGPAGTAGPELQQALTSVKAELSNSLDTVGQAWAVEGPYVVDPNTHQPNRPRSAIEVGAAILLAEHEEFGEPGAVPRHIVARDIRGFAVPLGNQPGLVGTVPAPFADMDNDGFADVDGHGRFADMGGMPLPINQPFFPSLPYSGPLPPDPAAPELYEYIDTSRTLTAAVARDVVALADPTAYAAPEDLEPWLVENEAFMYALAGVHVLAGPRELAQYDPVTEAVVAAGQPCPGCLQYNRFRGEDSPLPDLIHAAGQILAHPDSDAMLLHLLDLAENHEAEMARLLGAALAIDEIAEAHDLLADQGVEPRAELAYEVTLWDEVAAVVSDITEEPGLIQALVRALADPQYIEGYQQDGAYPASPPGWHYGNTLASFMRHRDLYQYDPNGINDPVLNISDSPPARNEPHHPVDRAAPINGDNRSMWERSIQLIFDTFGVVSCNKEDARVYVAMLDMYWPLIGANYTECELFTFDNVGAYYLDSILDLTHPKRSELIIKSNTLNVMLNTLGLVMDPGAFLEDSSGIDGMTLFPTPAALNRLVFFGASSDQFGTTLPDYDGINADTDTGKFVSNTLEPLCGPVCPTNANNVPHCANMDDVNRVRDRGTIFAWERQGFARYMRPQAEAFATPSCNGPPVTACDTTDYTGEEMFGNIIGSMWRHWPDHNAGPYCDFSGDAETNPRHCSGAGLNHYEPIMAEGLDGDMMPALQGFSALGASKTVTIERGPDAGSIMTGPQILELLAKLLFSEQYAASVGMTDRHGNAQTTWVDGSHPVQITPYRMFADALHRMDMRFQEACAEQGLAGDPACEADQAARRSKWRRARSLLVDRFLGVEGEGPQARFRNRAVKRTLVTVLKVLREQLNANCPDRETTRQPCVWATTTLARKMSDVLSRPIFAAVADVTDKINANDSARRELERFLTHTLQSGSTGEALQGMLGALNDIVQIVAADRDFHHIFRAASTAASPTADPEGPGVVDRTIDVLYALTGDEYDRYHVLDYVLPQLVTPMANGRTPIEVIIDAIADINRIDAASNEPLTAEDYRFVFQSVREFFTSRTRGFEQLYHIVQNRPHE